MYRLARLFAIFIFLAPLELQAIALGDIELHSALNQPLDAQVELLSLGETELDDIDVQLASPEAFDRVGLERPFFLTDLRFALEEKAGKPYLLITSKQPLKEPFVDFLLEVEWPNGRLLREYTLLLDPPVFLEESPAAVAAPQLAATAVAAPGGSQQEQETAPRTAPAAAALAGAAASTASGGLGYGPVTRSDTLWSIAKQLRPDNSVTVPQVMMALLKNNPEAFYKNNVNYLKAGYMLRIPDPAAIAEIDPRDAERQISRQNQQWQDARRQRADQALKRPLGSGEGQGGGSAAAAVTENQGGGAPRLRLVVPDTNVGETALQGVSDKTAPGASSEADLDALRRELALALETSEVSRQENAELRDRLTTLEEQISSMQRLLTLRDDTMSAIQSGAVDGAGQVADASAVPQEAAAQQDGSAQPAAVAPAEGRQVQASQPKATPPPGTEPPQDFISQLLADPMLLGAAGGVALLVLALAWVMVHRRRGDDDADFQGYQEATADDSPANPGQAPAAPQDDQGVASVAEEIGETVQGSSDALGMDVFQPEEDEIDTLAEADVYLAYRRFDKAEELLKDAIAQEPHRHDYVLKLLEVYVASENRDAFIAQAEALHAVVGEAGSEVWDKVVALGRQFLPEHPLFVSAGENGEAAAEDSWEEAGLEKELSGLNLDEESEAAPGSEQDAFASRMEEDRFAAALPTDETPPEAQASGAAEASTENAQEPAFGNFNVSGAEQEQQEEDLDLDFDLGDLSELEGEAEAAARTAEEVPVALGNEEPAVGAPDFQAEVSPDQQGLPEESPVGSLGGEGPVGSSAVETASSVQEFEQLEELAETVISRNDAALTDNSDALAGDSTDDAAVDHVASTEASQGEDMAGATADSDLEADIDWLANLDGEEMDMEVESAEEEESDLISGEDEVSTKLDLARAYIDMGDQESARSILHEVLNEGNDSQKGEAEELMHKIG